MDHLKLKKFLFSLTLILISLTSLANAYRIDSIRVAIDNILKTKGNKALKTNINTDYYSAETTKINQYLSVANKFQTSNDDSLLFYSQKAMGLSLKLADLEYISSSVQMLGNYFKRKEDYSNSGECYLLSLKIEEKNKNRKRIADFPIILMLLLNMKRNVIHLTLQKYIVIWVLCITPESIAKKEVPSRKEKISIQRSNTLKNQFS